jgi:hypothetical protein
MRDRRLRIVIVAAIILLLGYILWKFMQNRNGNSQAQASTAGATSTGSQQPVYTPTSESFTSAAVNYNGTYAPNNTGTVGNTQAGQNYVPPLPAGGSTTSTPVPPPIQISGGGNNVSGPPVVNGSFGYYTVPASVASKGLAAVAAMFGTTWQNLYTLNKNTIDSTAKANGRGPVGNEGYAHWLYAGETLLVPMNNK